MDINKELVKLWDSVIDTLHICKQQTDYIGTLEKRIEKLEGKNEKRKTFKC